MLLSTIIATQLQKPADTKTALTNASPTDTSVLRSDLDAARPESLRSVLRGTTLLSSKNLSAQPEIVSQYQGELLLWLANSEDKELVQKYKDQVAKLKPGAFDEITEQLTKEFQSRNGLNSKAELIKHTDQGVSEDQLLVVDGVVGPRTSRALRLANKNSDVAGITVEEFQRITNNKWQRKDGVGDGTSNINSNPAQTPSSSEPQANQPATETITNKFLDFGIVLNSSKDNADIGLQIDSLASSSILSGLIKPGSKITSVELDGQDPMKINTDSDLRVVMAVLGNLPEKTKFKVNYIDPDGMLSVRPLELAVTKASLKDLPTTYAFKFGQNSTGRWFWRNAKEGAVVTSIYQGLDKGSADTGDLAVGDIIREVEYTDPKTGKVKKILLTDNPDTVEVENNKDKCSIYLDKILKSIPVETPISFVVQRGDTLFTTQIKSGRKVPAPEVYVPEVTYYGP
jgi:hypothetical protein